jgi:hypothetical protein
MKKILVDGTYKEVFLSLGSDNILELSRTCFQTTTRGVRSGQMGDGRLSRWHFCSATQRPQKNGNAGSGSGRTLPINGGAGEIKFLNIL